jgi:hypothetical protein
MNCEELKKLEERIICAAADEKAHDLLYCGYKLIQRTELPINFSNAAKAVLARIEELRLKSFFDLEEVEGKLRSYIKD